MLNRSTLGVSLIAVMSLAIACQRDVGLTTSLNVRASLSSATSNIVLVQVVAEQGGETQRASLDAGGDTVTVTLEVGIPATITGTVFTFAPTQWRSFTSTQTVTPQVGSSDIELTLKEQPGVSGSFIPTVTVHGAQADVINEPLAISLHDVDTDFQIDTPFTTGMTIEIPSGRAVVFSVPDRFSGGTAERSLDTSQFADATQIALSTDATIGIQGDNLPSLIDALTPLAANDLGLQCAVDGDCTTGSFTTCSPAIITLETERSYEVSVRYSNVPGSCETTRVTRDLTPPTFSTSWTPPFVQPGLAALTVSISADEAIDPASIVLTSGSSANRCTPTATGASQVACAVDLSGLDLSKSLQLQAVVADLAGQTSTRTLTIHVRDSNPVQVVGLQTIPERPSINDGFALVGITVAAFDNDGLCGISTGVYDFTAPLPTADFQTDDGATWYGPSFAPAHADNSPTVVTYWASMRFFPSGPLVPGAYIGSGAVPVLPCGARTAQSPALNDTIEMIDTPVRWITPGPLALSALAGGGINPFPLVGARPSGDGSPSPDRVASSDTTVLFSSFQTGQGSTYLAGLKPGSARLTATSTGRTDPSLDVSVAIDVDVVAPPDILALQAGRLVRRGHSSDVVTPLPSEIGDTLRVLWESEREDVIVVGSHGVWVQDATGATHTVLDPCGADDVIDGTLTASAPAHASQMRDLALLVHEGRPVHHCEVDLTALATTIDVPIHDCDAGKVFGDSRTGQFFAAGTGCAVTYVATSAAATTLQSTTFTTDGPIAQLAADEHAALALVLAGDQVFGFNLFGPLAANVFDFTRFSPTATFAPTAIAINPISGTPMIAGDGNDNQGIGEEATVFMGYTDHLGQQPRYTELARLDPNAYVPPTALLFDTASRSLYSSRPGNTLNGISASMLILDTDIFNGSTLADLQDRPIRAWPDGLDVIDMVMAGPQPTNMSTASADVGQSVTITGAGFNGGGRDHVYVQGIPVVVTASSRDSVTFTMPQGLHTLTISTLGRLLLQVAVRSSGMLSGPVPMSYGYSNIELPAILPGSYIAPFFGNSQACGSGCGAGMKMVDALGYEGILEVRHPGDSIGVAILDGSANQDISPVGFLGPVRVPGPRRVVGSSGTSLYDVFPPAFDETTTQPFTAVRSLAVAQTVTAVAPSPDGHVLAVADGAGIDFRWSGNFAAHPATRVVVASTSQLTMTSKNLLVAATATGGVNAVRFTDTTPSLVSVAVDTSACPTGGRSEVLALAHDVSSGDVLMVSRYSTTLASEVMRDDGTSVTQRCLSTGPMTSIITGAVTASALDRTGTRAVLVAGSLAYLYDTSDMRLPMMQADVAAGIEGVFIPESGGGLTFYDVFAYYTQPLIEP